MPETRTATVEHLLKDITGARDTGQALRRRVEALRVCGLAAPSDIVRLERALEAGETADMWDNMPV